MRRKINSFFKKLSKRLFIETLQNEFLHILEAEFGKISLELSVHKLIRLLNGFSNLLPKSKKFLIQIENSSKLQSKHFQTEQKEYNSILTVKIYLSIQSAFSVCFQTHDFLSGLNSSDLLIVCFMSRQKEDSSS